VRENSTTAKEIIDVDLPKGMALGHAIADDALMDRYVQRSALLGFPDAIVVRYMDQPGGTSMVAIYSRSQLGNGDMWVNKARIERWLGKLKKVVSLSR
jgi:uncharacterized protein (DUF1499 family)